MASSPDHVPLYRQVLVSMVSTSSSSWVLSVQADITVVLVEKIWETLLLIIWNKWEDLSYSFHGDQGVLAPGWCHCGARLLVATTFSDSLLIQLFELFKSMVSNFWND